METMTISKSKKHNMILHGRKKRFKYILGISALFIIFSLGFLIGYLVNNQKRQQEPIEENSKVSSKESPYLSDKPIRSPLNGMIIDEPTYEKIIKNIPHAVLISNNASARDEQFGLNYSDIVYEAETEGGITRFMGIFWNNQEDYQIKPIRSVRKYFLDWAIEYGNIPITFSGFAETDNVETNAWGFYQENDLRVTYFDWPFAWDDECLIDHPSMHCKYITPKVLYSLFQKHEWTYNSWTGFKNGSEWLFKEDLGKKESYSKMEEFSYDFTYENDWSSRWEYNKDTGTYLKYDPVNEHTDMNNNSQIEASTVVMQISDRYYTGDDKGRVIYKTVGEGKVYIARDGIIIEGIWKKECHKCRTKYFHVKHQNVEIPLKPGRIWISAVPSDKEIHWKET